MTKRFTKGRTGTSYGFLLWALILTGYFIFVFNWVIMNKLTGSASMNSMGVKNANANGWIAEFFTKDPSSTVKQAVNYTITAMRGLGAIGAGFVIAKVGHKYAVVIALGLLSLALPSVFFSHIHSSAGYYMFIVGRMLMAVGGTVLIVYTQPIISHYFNAKQKGTALMINSVGFNLGAALPLILFMIAPIRESMLNNWEIWAAAVAGTPIILLVTYWFVGKDCEILPDVPGESKEVLKPTTWGSVAKEKNTWKLGLIFGGWLVMVVAVILIMPGHFSKIHEANFGAQETWEKLLPIVLFLVGLVPGIFLVGWINKHEVDRRLYIAVVSTLAIVFIASAYLLNVYTKSIVGPSIFMFLAGIAGWGVQGVILMTPHEFKGNSSKRIGIMMGFVWGIGYFIYTITNIVMAVIFDALPKSQLVLGSWIQFGIYVAVAAALPIVIMLLPKTREKTLSSLIKEKIKK